MAGRSRQSPRRCLCQRREDGDAQNLVANRNFSDDVVELFIKHAAKCGVDVFRVFDPLNDLRNMEATVGAALKAKKKVQGALSYAISPAHNIELWCSLANHRALGMVATLVVRALKP